jgi:hypothetical protein
MLGAKRDRSQGATVASMRHRSAVRPVFLLAVLVTVTAGACGGGAAGAMGAGGSTGTAGASGDAFPVNETFAAELIAMGIPEDVARFFAAATLEGSSPDPTTYVYKQTFPNGAVRTMTMKLTPNQTVTPTADEVADVAAGQAPIYSFTYADGDQPNGDRHVDLGYFVADEDIPPELSAELRSSALPAQPIERVARALGGNGSGPATGSGISWVETGQKGADVTILSLLDYAKAHGITLGPLASIYALASALSDITMAVDVGKQNAQWFVELAALEMCAANPTNPVAKSDPSYSPAAVAKVQGARSELQQVGAVRFLNIMTETLAGITPATAVLSVALKSGFSWNEQTLKDYSLGTIMAEARAAVVACDNATQDGNVDVAWDCLDTGLMQVDHEMWHTKAQVTWVWNPASMLYLSQGSYTYDQIKTSTLNGKTCTYQSSAAGDIGNTGTLMVVNDAAYANLVGYGYSATGEVMATAAFSDDCGGTPSMGPVTIDWLPPIKAFPATGGAFEGTQTTPSCVGTSSTGTQIVTWGFSVPPPM